MATTLRLTPPRITKPSSTVAPAIFMDKKTVYQADKCDPLASAADRGEVGLWMWSRGAYPGSRLPEQTLREVSSIGVWDASREQSWGLDWHRNEGLEITYLEQGGLEFAVDDWKGRLQPGNMTVTRPWQQHRVGNPGVGASRLYWLILDVGVRQPHTAWHWPDWVVLSPGDLEELTEYLRGNEQPVWPSNREIGNCFRKWWGMLREGDAAASESRLKVQINELLLHLLESIRQAETPVNPGLATARRTVQLFLAQLPKHLDYAWDLASMSGQCGMARSQFTLHCRSLTNRTPMSYLTDCRIEAAKVLLADRPDLNVTEIAASCGFQTSQYFATRFRIRAGSAPAEYRKIALLKRAPPRHPV